MIPFPRWLRIAVAISGCAATGSCDTTEPSEPKAVDLFLPGALDVDHAAVTDSVGVGRGSEVQIYSRSGAAWFASVPGIQVAYRDQMPSVTSCASAHDWNVFEAPVASLKAQTYFCVTTSQGHVGWLRVDHFAGVDEVVTVHFAINK